MAKVENVGGIYASLGYDYDDPNGHVNELSANTKIHLNSAPAFIETWQANDIATSNVGGYTKNPVSVYANTINSEANSIHTLVTGLNGSTGTITALFDTIANTCNDITGYTYNAGTEFVPSYVTVEGEVSKFNKHTDRISGTRSFAQDVVSDPTTTATKPYFDTAIAYGKQVMYITNQTDSIVNTSPILGSFTSVMCGPQLYDLANTLTAHESTINASITVTVTYEGMNAITTRTSNLSLSTVTQISSDISNTKNTMITRRTHDENFFTKQKDFVEQFRIVKRFSSMGESETYLAKNLIGTDKLLERIG